MKFVDQAFIQIKSGDGGPGGVSFRREKFVPKGGPDGGDGGRGGHVILAASSQKDTLYRFHLNQHFRAEKGRSGRGGNRHGRNGADLIIKLPLGATVRDAETGAFLVDLTRPGQRFIAAEGGRGGKGNAHFASSTNRAPRRAQPGRSGLEMRLHLELKLLADIGLIGLPNAGKSTLLSRISAARPKIADYPFTTLIPALGVVSDGEERSFVMADIPGLIQGAGRGAGLGHRFLKHVQRCLVLIHLLDAGRIDPEAPLSGLEKINAELAEFDLELARKPQVVVVNKLDLPGADEILKIVRKALPGQKVLGISAVGGQGLAELTWALFDVLEERREAGADGEQT